MKPKNSIKERAAKVPKRTKRKVKRQIRWAKLRSETLSIFVDLKNFLKHHFNVLLFKIRIKKHH
jgi:hypothetical protein